MSEARPADGFGIGDAILILIGLVFLLENLNVPFLTNWWALFLLIPAFSSYVAAWQRYRAEGRLTPGAAGSGSPSRAACGTGRK